MYLPFLLDFESKSTEILRFVLSDIKDTSYIRAGSSTDQNCRTLSLTRRSSRCGTLGYLCPGFEDGDIIARSRTCLIYYIPFKLIPNFRMAAMAVHFHPEEKTLDREACSGQWGGWKGKDLCLPSETMGCVGTAAKRDC